MARWIAAVTPTEVFEWFDTQPPAGQKAHQMERVIHSVGDEIESYCGRRFGSEPDIRFYDLSSPTRSVLVGDIQSSPAPVISLADGRGGWELLPESSWRLWSPHDNPGWPHRWIRRTDGEMFPAGIDAVRVEAHFGFGDAPDAVIQAAVMKSFKIYMRRKAPSGNIVAADGSDLGGFSAWDPDVQDLLNPFRVNRVA